MKYSLEIRSESGGLRTMFNYNHFFANNTTQESIFDWLSILSRVKKEGHFSVISVDYFIIKQIKKSTIVLSGKFR